MGDISRRKFLKGTGKTILTAGALSSGVLTTSSTPTPVKTATTATTTWKNLNVLSPKAKAYRSYLRGLKHWTSAAAMPKKYKEGIRLWQSGTKNIVGSKLRSSGKLGSFISKQRVGAGIKATTGISLARQSFIHSITSSKQGFPIAQSTAPGRIIARSLDPPTGPYVKNMDARQRQLRATGSMRAHEKGHSGQLKNRIAKNLHTGARKELAKELRVFRKANPDRMHKKVSARIHKENVNKILKKQERTVRQEKAAGKLGTKLKNLISNLRSKPRAYK